MTFFFFVLCILKNGGCLLEKMKKLLQEQASREGQVFYYAC